MGLPHQARSKEETEKHKKYDLLKEENLWERVFFIMLVNVLGAYFGYDFLCTWHFLSFYFSYSFKQEEVKTWVTLVVVSTFLQCYYGLSLAVWILNLKPKRFPVFIFSLFSVFRNYCNTLCIILNWITARLTSGDINQDCLSNKLLDTPPNAFGLFYFSMLVHTSVSGHALDFRSTTKQHDIYYQHK